MCNRILLSSTYVYIIIKVVLRQLSYHRCSPSSSPALYAFKKVCTRLVCDKFTSYLFKVGGSLYKGS